MRFDDSIDAIRLTADELNAAIAAAPSRGALALAFAPDESGAPAAEVSPGGQDAAPVLAEIASLLADPVRTATVHAAVADVSVKRLNLAWGSDGRVAVAARSGAHYIVQMRTSGEMAAMLGGLLGIGGPLSYAGVNVGTTARSVLVALALADALRKERYLAALAHVAPSGSVTAADVAERIAGAGVEDFRWLAPYFDKVLPFELASLLDAEAVGRELDRLVKDGLLDYEVAESGIPALYAPSIEGSALFDGLLHDVAKVAATVYAVEGGKTVYESMLLVRDAGHLWVFDMAGNAGSVASAGREAARALCDALAGVAAVAEIPVPPLPAPPAAAAAPPQMPPAPVQCPSCGELVLATSKFCMRCGTPIAKG